jgi:hypothetical protein
MIGVLPKGKLPLFFLETKAIESFKAIADNG